MASAPQKLVLAPCMSHATSPGVQRPRLVTGVPSSTPTEGANVYAASRHEDVGKGAGEDGRHTRHTELLMTGGKSGSISSILNIVILY